ncbi:hypothetical protein Bca101_016786 [Brassica carinata]
MESPNLVLMVVLGTLAIIHLVQAQDQQGFISLDCGLPSSEPSPYDEAMTGLRFSSDKELIQSGKTGRVRANPDVYLKPYETLRYFPDGFRNCYNLNVEMGRKHLIRAYFFYENYDGLDIKPKFDLYIGPNPWTTIDLQKEENGTRRELLHIPTSNSLQVCLVKTGETSPMISTLEIRPMGNDTYITKSGSLNLFSRMYLKDSVTHIRYPKDVYDRVWSPYFWREWTQISTTLEVSNSNKYLPPRVVLQTAATPTNASAPLTIQWRPSNVNDQYYLYVHFAEIQETNATREFTALIRTNRSTLPPLLNALEMYTVTQFPQSETNESDVAAVQNIKTTYGISRISWQGDPCVPQQLMWDGLNCRNTDVSTPPRITYLNLSSSGLTGTIAPGIQNLTQLEILDLSNNNLTGELPEFLSNMKSLVFINISWNDLNGSIPRDLRRKGLELHPQGNPRLCDSGSCLPPKTKPFPVAIVASVASAVAIIVAVLALIFVFGKKKPAVRAVQPPPSIPPIVKVTYADSPVSSSVLSIQTNKRRFTYSEVINMTNSFQRVVGKGGFGVVYHGTLNGYEQVAVKVLSQSSTQGYKQFRAEVDLLMRVHHANLVNLVGCCSEGDHLALIYEYYRTSRLTEKSDVYSFGIVLLEMITNEPVIDQARSKSHITQWVGFELSSGEISSIMDPNLHGDYDSRSAWRALELAMSCANPSSTKRPSMSQLVVELKECLLSESSKRSLSRGMDSQTSSEVYDH